MSLDRETIVATTLDYMDERGVQAVTMRTLGEVLGVEAMSLYHYVSGREDLLEAVVAHLLDELLHGIDRDESTSWQDYVQHVAHEVRRVSVEHPAVFPLLATQHPAAPWLRPPLRSVELVEDFLSTLRSYGIGDKQGVEVYRSFTSFVLGILLLESAARPGQETQEDADAAEPDWALPPTLVRLQGPLSEDHSTAEFERALETLLERMEIVVAYGDP